MGISNILKSKKFGVKRQLNTNLADEMPDLIKSNSTAGITAFAPLKGKDGKSAPISAYFELIVKYPELVGNGVDPTMYNLAKEALQAKADGATEAELNARYKLSVLRK